MAFRSAVQLLNRFPFERFPSQFVTSFDECDFSTQVLRSGGWSLLLQLLFQGYQGGPTARAGGSTQGQGRFETPQQDGHRVTMEQVTGELMKLPTEQYSTPDQLATLPVHDLKVCLATGSRQQCMRYSLAFSLPLEANL